MDSAVNLLNSHASISKYMIEGIGKRSSLPSQTLLIDSIYLELQFAELTKDKDMV